MLSKRCVPRHPSVATYPVSFDTVANSFELSKNSTPLLSCKSKLFVQNTRGWVWVTRADSDRNLFHPGRRRQANPFKNERSQNRMRTSNLKYL
jgi:hypothetical protein